MKITPLLLATGIASAIVLGPEAPALAAPETASSIIDARSIPDTLELVQSPANSPDPAVVRVVLKNGHSFEGSITEYSRDRSVCAMRDHSGKTTMINPGDISAVTLLHSGNAKSRLLGGKIFREGSEAPTLIALRREAERLSSRFSMKVAVLLPANESDNLDCRFSYGKMLGALESALVEVTKDAAGKTALAKFANGVTVEDAKEDSVLSVTAHQNLLNVRFDCRKPLVEGYIAALNKALSDVL